MLTRRDAIKHLIVSVGGTSLLSACGGQISLETLAPTGTPQFYSGPEIAVLTRVGDLLIPRTETPGALDVRVPALLDRLMTEWASAETQAEHRATLGALTAALDARAGAPFVALPDETAVEVLTAVDAAAFADEPIRGYQNLKGLIHQMYFATEAGALEEQEWAAVPGRWDPCVDRS